MQALRFSSSAHPALCYFCYGNALGDFPTKSFVPIETMLKKMIPIKRNLRDENLDNLQSLYYIQY